MKRDYWKELKEVKTYREAQNLKFIVQCNYWKSMKEKEELLEAIEYTMAELLKEGK